MFGGAPGATSGGDGGFAIAEVDSERFFHLVASKDGYVSELRRNAAIDEKAPLLLVLRRAARVEGKVVAGGRHPGAVSLELEAEGEEGRRDRGLELGLPTVFPDAGGFSSSAGSRRGATG